MTTNDRERKDILKYTGPTSLREIEDRLLEIEHEKPMRIHNASEDYSGSFEDEIEADEISYLDVEKKQLQFKRQFILDQRNDWKSKSFWSVIIPIIVSVTTAYLVSTFVL